MSDTVLDLTASTLPAGVILPAGATHTAGVGVTLPANTSIFLEGDFLRDDGSYSIKMRIDRTPGGISYIQLKTHITENSYYVYSYKLGQFGNGLPYWFVPHQTSIATSSTGFFDFDSQQIHDLHVIVGVGGSILMYANNVLQSSAQATSYTTPADPQKVEVHVTGETLLTQITVVNFVNKLDKYTYTPEETITFTGGPFPLDQQVSMHIYDTDYDVTSEISTQTEDNIVLPLSVNTTISYGVDITYTIDAGNGNLGSSIIQLTPVSGKDYTIVVDPLTDSDSSIFQNHAGDTVADGFQVEYTETDSFQINTNGTYEYSGVGSSVSSSIRVYSTDDYSWSNTSTLDITINDATIRLLDDYTFTNDNETVTCVVVPPLAEGSLYATIDKTGRKPSVDQLKNGLDFYGNSAEWSHTIAINDTNAETFSITGLTKADYTFYCVHVASDDSITNTIAEDFSILATRGLVTIDSVNVTTTSANIVFTYDDTDQTGFEYSLNNSTSSPVAASPLNLTGLNDNTTYSIKIRAVNSRGAGTWSDTFTFKTEQTPSILTLTDVNNAMPDGNYLVDIYQTNNKTFVVTTTITFTSNTAIVDLTGTVPPGTEVWVQHKGSNPPTTGFSFIEVTE